MRTKITILAALAAMLLPATLLAGPRNSNPRGGQTQHDRQFEHDQCGAHGSHQAGHRGPSLVVSNPNAQAVSVYADGQLLGLVPAASKARFSPRSVGRQLIEVVYEGPVHRQPRLFSDQLWVGRGRTRIEVGVAEVGLVELENGWVEPLELFVNGRSRGSVAARSTRVVMHRDGAQLELRAPGGAVVLSRGLHGGALATTALRFQPAPWSTVSVRNPTRAQLQLVDKSTGRVLANLAPNRMTEVRVPTGRARLEVQFAGRSIDQTRLLAVPWTAARWSVQPPSIAELTLHNPDRSPVAVFVDGRFVGQVGAHESRTFGGVRVGAVEVRVETQRGRRSRSQTASVQVDPLFGARFTPQPARRGEWRAERTHRRGVTHAPSVVTHRRVSWRR